MMSVMPESWAENEGIQVLIAKIDEHGRRMDNGFSRVEARFEKVDEAFERVDERFEEVEARFEKVDGRFERVDERFERVDERFEEVDGRFEKQETSLAELRKEMMAGFESINDRIFRFNLAIIAALLVTQL